MSYLLRRNRFDSEDFRLFQTHIHGNIANSDSNTKTMIFCDWYCITVSLNSNHKKLCLKVLNQCHWKCGLKRKPLFYTGVADSIWSAQTSTWKNKKKKRLRLGIYHSVPLGQFTWIFPFLRTVCYKQKPWVQVAWGLGDETEPWKRTHSTSH